MFVLDLEECDLGVRARYLCSVLYDFRGSCWHSGIKNPQALLRTVNDYALHVYEVVRSVGAVRQVLNLRIRPGSLCGKVCGQRDSPRSSATRSRDVEELPAILVDCDTRWKVPIELVNELEVRTITYIRSLLGFQLIATCPSLE